MACVSKLTLTVLALLVLNASTVYALEILQDPLSLLVPANTIAEFTCEIQCPAKGCVVYWNVNGISTAHQHQKDLFEEKGFIFFPYHNSGSVYKSRLQVTAGVSINNTSVCCLALDGASTSFIKTNLASLKVISDSPLIPNPSVTLLNATSALLEWSPPFLWPGQHIQYFNVSVMNSYGNRSKTHVKITTASFSDAIVSLPLDNLDYYQGRNCFKYVFMISATSNDFMDLGAFNVTGYYPSALGNISKEAIEFNCTVLFYPNASPFLVLEIKLPDVLCVHQNVTYIIIIYTNEDLLAAQHVVGPYSHNGSGVLSHNIFGVLKKDYNYSVRVLMESVDGIVQSKTHFFDTNFDVDPTSQNACTDLETSKDVFAYKLVIAISLATAVMVLLILVVMLLCIFVDRSKIKLQRNNGSSLRATVKACSIMVNNPLYDGPMYETIQPSISSPQMLTPNIAPTSSLTQSCKADCYMDQDLLCNTVQHQGEIHLDVSYPEKEAVYSCVGNDAPLM